MKLTSFVLSTLLALTLSAQEKEPGKVQKALGKVGGAVDKAAEKTVEGTKTAAEKTADASKTAAKKTAETSKDVAGKTADGAEVAGRKTAGATGSGVSRAGDAVKGLGQLDINSATEKELNALPGIGDAYSAKIINGRPYARKDELVSKGILPESTYEKIKNRVVARQPKK